MLLPLAVKAGQMLVKKLSKFLANFIKFNKMSKLWCADQFLVLSLHFYKEKKKSCESVSIQHMLDYDWQNQNV